MSPALPRPGDVFDDRYRIEAAIGRGGFGCVYRALDLKLERPIALKVAWPEPGCDDRLKRFWREAELSRGLVHPHTVRVYDIGVGPGGSPFIAFELLDGESLARRLQRTGALSVGETRRIAACVLKSLMEAHALGIVHRDIKPANVFLCRYAGETDFVKVLDFGIAKAPRRTELTAHGWLVGTPQFMAPEQITDDALGPRADLYSLGLVMAQMLAGEPVLQGPTASVIVDQLSDEPLPLSTTVLESSLGPVIRRATEKNPGRRHASAAEMLGDLVGSEPLERTLACAPDAARAEGLRRSLVPASVAPVAVPVAPSTPPAPAASGPGPSWGWVLAAGALAFVLAVASTTALVLATRSADARLARGLDAHHPGLELPVLRLAAGRAGIRLGAARAGAPESVELSFRHASSVGVLRVRALATPNDAARALADGRGDGRSAARRRGRRVIRVWAAPRGKAHFDPALAERLLGAAGLGGDG